MAPKRIRNGASLNMYVPPELKERFEALARRHRRPLTVEVIHAMERHLASPPTVVESPLPDSPSPSAPPKRRGRPRKHPEPTPASTVSAEGHDG